MNIELSLSEFVNESKTLSVVQQIEFVENSPAFRWIKEPYIKLLRGEKITAYHGTNVNFKKFDYKLNRSDRNSNFFGNGIFLTLDNTVARKYADSNANSTAQKSIIFDNKTVDKNVLNFMKDLYDNGNKAWSNKKHEKVLQSSYNYKGLDANDFADIVRKIDGNKLYNSNDEDELGNLMDIMSGSQATGMDYYLIEDLSKLGFGDFRPRVLTVEFDTSGLEVFITKSTKAAEKSKADIIIIHSNKNLVDEEPEIKLKSNKGLRIIKSEVV